MLVRYFDLARGIVERFGGVIDKYTGDAVTAFWGARITREDDAERAVRAGLALVESVATLGVEIGIPELSLRVGVLTGEASVGPGGNETGLIVGDIVNTASRLQAHADPGTVLVGESTRALAEGALSFESVGAVELKGLPHPVEAYRAGGPAGDPESRSNEDVEHPFVGRRFELRMLEDMLDGTAEQRSARLVSIIGDAGVGKSRLVRELAEYATARARPFLWHVGRSPLHGDGVALWAIAAMIRQRAGIGENDDQRRGREKLAATVAEYCVDAEEQRWILSRLTGLLGIDPLPTGDRDDLFGALRTFFQRVSGRAAVVLVFEDLHRSDDALLAFIADLVERSREHPLLVVTLARPELLAHRPDWGSASHNFNSIHIGPLADADMAALVSEMVPGIEENTVDLVTQAAAGVPLYAVEYVRMLVASGDLVRQGDRFRQVGAVDTLALPDSLQAMVGARLDRLDPIERAMVQDAAVLGQSFTVAQFARATARMVEEVHPALQRLVAAGVLQTESDRRTPEQTQYRFVQSTFREVAYRRLSKTERSQRHLAIVDRFGEGDVAEHATVVASHYLSALEARPDPELATRARQALLDAARRATELHAHQHALHLITKALEIPGEEADRVPLWDLGIDSASASGAHDTALALARKGLDWQTGHGFPAGVTRARYRLGRALLAAELPAQAVDALDRHFDPTQNADDEMARLGLVLARAHFGSGNNRRAADIARDILLTSALVGDPELVVGLLRIRGLALEGIDRVHESLALLREAVRLAGELDSPAVEAAAIGSLILVDGVNGRRRDLGPPTRLLELAAKAGSPAIESYARSWLGRIQTAVGDFTQARESYKTDSHRTDVVATYDRSRVLFLDWVLDGDPRHLDEAVALLEPADDQGDPLGRAIRLSALSQYAYASGDPERAFEIAQSADYAFAVPHSFLFDIPILAALRLEDVDRLRHAQANLPAKPGLRFASLAAVASAGIEILEDASEEAAARFLEAATRHAAVDGAADEAQLQAILAETLPHSETARAVGRQAHDWFTRHGARGYLAIYSAAWRISGVDGVSRLP